MHLMPSSIKADIAFATLVMFLCPGLDVCLKILKQKHIIGQTQFGYCKIRDN